jgi:hypothetical protein
MNNPNENGGPTDPSWTFQTRSSKKQSNGSSQVNNDDISCPLTFQSF